MREASCSTKSSPRSSSAPMATGAALVCPVARAASSSLSARLGVDAEEQARHGGRHVRAREDVRELVGDDRLQLRPREARERPSVTPTTPPPCRSLKAKAFIPSVGTVTHSMRRRARGDAQLLDDVGETLVVAVAAGRAGRRAWRAAAAARASDARAEPVHDRDEHRDPEDQQRVLRRSRTRRQGHARGHEHARPRRRRRGRPARRRRRSPDEEQREQQPDAPALFALDLEDRLAWLPSPASQAPQTKREKGVYIVETVVIYRLHAGVPLHTSLPVQVPPGTTPWLLSQAPLPEGLPEIRSPPRPFGLPGPSRPHGCSGCPETTIRSRDGRFWATPDGVGIRRTQRRSCLTYRPTAGRTRAGSSS